MDLVALQDKAVSRMAELVAKVQKEQLPRETPCSEWDVKSLLNHIIGGNHMFASAAKGSPTAAEGVDHTDGDIAAAFEESARALREAWSDPTKLGETVQLPFGEMSGAQALALHTMDKIVHAWDLATATNQDVEIPEELLQGLKGIVDQVPLDDVRKTGVLGPAVPTPPGASLQEEILGKLGRKA